MIAAVVAPPGDGDSPLALWAQSALMSKGDPILRIADELARIRAGVGQDPRTPAVVECHAATSLRRPAPHLV